MAYERQLIHNARANPPPGWVGEAPAVAIYKHNLQEARQAMHSHNAHVRTTTENTNEYVWEMVRVSYN